MNGKTFSFSEKTLTLELIGKMNANNTEAIELLNIESKIGDIINIILTISIIIIMLFIDIERICCRRKKQCSGDIAPIPTQKIILNISNPRDTSIAKISQIHTFD